MHQWMMFYSWHGCVHLKTRAQLILPGVDFKSVVKKKKRGVASGKKSDGLISTDDKLPVILHLITLKPGVILICRRTVYLQIMHSGFS